MSEGYPLEKRVAQFSAQLLPVHHIDASNLVNDLWREVQRLRRLEKAIHSAVVSAGSFAACFYPNGELREQS